MTAAAGRVAVLGIRHHGPGSARSVLAELDRLSRTAVLIEGPADADPLVALAADPELRPPVALLGYAAGRARELLGVLAVRRVLPGVAGADAGPRPRRAGPVLRPAGLDVLARRR